MRKESRDHKVLTGHQAHKDLKVNKEIRAHLAYKGCLGRQVLKAETVR